MTLMALFSPEILSALKEWKDKDDISLEEYELAEKLYDDFAKYPAIDEEGNVIDYTGKVPKKEEQMTEESLMAEESAENDHCALGNAALAADALDIAIECFSNAIQKNPEDIVSWNNIALAYLKRAKDADDLEQVIASCDRVIKLDPSIEKVRRLVEKHDAIVLFLTILLLLGLLS
jgi:tetratricopeptide (TPR) repeat protein